MKTTRKFEADDGTAFDTKRECMAYEKGVEAVMRLAAMDEDVAREAVFGPNEEAADVILAAAKHIGARRRAEG